MDPTRATAAGLLAQLNSGSVSAEEVARAYLDRASAFQRLNAFVHLDADAVLAQARAVDEKPAAGGSRSGCWPGCRWRSRTSSA